MRAAMQGKEQAISSDNSDQEDSRLSTKEINILKAELEKVQLKMQAANVDNSYQESSKSSTKEIKILKAEIEQVQLQMQELQRDYTELQRQYEKLKFKQSNLLGWTFGWRKIKNSGFFNGKVNGSETEEGQERSNSGCHRVSLRRRLLSIS